MGQALSLWTKQAISHSFVRAQNRTAVLAAEAGDADSEIWLVVGLGNPGPRYAGNRHNVGFQAIDELARRGGQRATKVQFGAAVARRTLEDRRLLLAKPMTFMNNSGEAVGRLARYYKIPPERVVAIYDDLDIPCAEIRLRTKGGSGGHNGMKSLSQHLGGNNFPRIRIGIGRPAGGRSVIEHVLQDFTAQEQADIDVAIAEAIATLSSVLKLGMDRALSGMRV